MKQASAILIKQEPGGTGHTPAAALAWPRGKMYLAWLLAATLIAWAVRLHNLTYHSLWFDEAISVHWARQSAPRILAVGFTLVEDRLPPLYYLLLKGWTGLAGFSEAGVRSLSVLPGVLLVPLVASLAALLLNRRAAVLAAILVALNPFLVWYAQEARMYSQAAFFSALAVWAWLRLLPHLSPAAARPASLFFFGLFVLSATAGLYSHLYSGFVLPALGLWLVVSYPRAWRTWGLFAAGGLAAGLAFAPLAVATWRFSGEATPGQPLAGLGERAWWLLHAFTVWKAPLPAGLQVAVPAVVAGFALAGYLQPAVARRLDGRPGPKNPLLLLALLLLAPFFIATLLLWRNYLAFFGERYFIVMTPWLLLLAGAGAINLSDWLCERFGAWAGRLVPLLLVAATALPLPGQWTIAAAKEAWRQSVAYLAERAAPDHAILIHPDWVRYPFQFYFRGPGQTYAAFSNVGPDTPLDGPLQGILATNPPVLWLIQSHLDGPDPNHLVEQWLAARFPLVTELYPPGISLTGYATGYQLEALPPEATPADLPFEPGLRLVGYHGDSRVSARDELFHPPSGWLHVSLYWTADRPVAAPVRPFVNLVGPEGVWGASLERANDALGLFPPERWPAGGGLIVRQDLDVNLNPATPPGTYQLVVGLPGDPNQYPLGQVEVE